MLYFFARARIAGQRNSRACSFCLLFVLVRRDDFYPDALERDYQNDDDEQKEEEYYRSFLPPGLLSQPRPSVSVTTHRRRNRYPRLQIEERLMLHPLE